MLAYIVYISLMCFMIMCTSSWSFQHKRTKISCQEIQVLIPIIFFTVIIGLRYDVGLDYLNYYNSYLEQSFSDMPWNKYEPGFVLLNKMLYSLQLPPCFLFMSIAFLQILFFYKTFEDKPFMLSTAIFLLFIMGQVFSMINIMRHFTAAMIVLYGFRYVCQKSTVWKFIICVICATLFHYSAIITLPVALLSFYPRLTFLDRRWILLAVFIIIVIFQEKLATFFINNAIAFIFDMDVSTVDGLGFNSNKLSSAVGQYVIDEGTGYGRLINYLIVIVSILMSKHLYHVYGIKYLQYFRIYYLGQLFITSIGMDMNLRRLGMFFTLSSVVIFTYCFYYILSTWKKISPFYQLLTAIFIGYFLILFFHKISISESGCSPWKFI